MSWPAVGASGPSCPQPVMRAKINRGFPAAQSSGPIPRRSQVPGRKQSSSTSALAANSNKACGWLLTSRSTIRFPRCSRSRSSAGICRPPGRRTRTTSAPRSASTIPACGPGSMPPSSMTFTPARGPPPATVATQPFFTFSTCLRSSSRPDSTVPFTARLSTNPGSGTTASTASSSFTRVLSPSGVKR